MKRMPMLPVLLLTVLAMAGCFAPKAQEAARNWRPLGVGGLTLGELLAVSPCVKNVVWEMFAGDPGQTVVRASVEYDPAQAATGCPKREKDDALASRLFLILDLAVTAKSGDVAFLAAKAQAYNAAGYFEEYWLDIGVLADITAKAFPIPCADIVLPSYLR